MPEIARRPDPAPRSFINSLVQTYSGRISADAPGGAAIIEAISKVQAVVNTLHEKVEGYKKDTDNSPTGARKKSMEALKQYLPAVHDHTRSMRNAIADAGNAKRNFDSKVSPKTTDVLAYLRQKDIRDHVLKLPAGDRLKWLTDHVDNLELCHAIVTAPVPEMTGLPAAQLEVFRTAFIEKHYAAEVRNLADRQRLAEECEGIIAVTHQHVCAICEVSGKDLAAILGKRKFRDVSTMTDEEFNQALTEKMVRFDALRANESWAVTQYNEDPIEFLWPNPDLRQP